MHDGIATAHGGFDSRGIANIAFDEFIFRVLRQGVLQVGEIAGVGELIEINDRCGILSHPLQDEIRPDKSRATGDKNAIVHAKTVARAVRVKLPLQTDF